MHVFYVFLPTGEMIPGLDIYPNLATFIHVLSNRSMPGRCIHCFARPSSCQSYFLEVAVSAAVWVCVRSVAQAPTMGNGGPSSARTGRK